MSVCNSIYDENHLCFSNRINTIKSNLRIIATKYIETDNDLLPKSWKLIFHRNFYDDRIFYTLWNFFPSPKYDEEHFHFLNHVNPTKIEENIGPSDPLPKTTKKGGVWHRKPSGFRVCLQTKPFFADDLSAALTSTLN